ncbi:MAG: T9SS type A sorting domain-containing protein [Candidatus Krumholzibacteriota bacterium]|nr:T9SS type A sorting domain-containing protein [Candidatus Krumholzibacteriota bacterium]
MKLFGTKTAPALLITGLLLATAANAAWVADGNPVCMHEENDFDPCIASDEAGGAIIAWACLRPYPDPHAIFANRIDGQGNRLWGADGTQVDLAEWHSTTPPDIASDGTGGAIVCWSGSNGDGTATIRAQRMNASGGHLWAAGGVELCTGASEDPAPSVPRLTSDGSGGAIVVWYNQHNGDYDLYARRVDGAGNVLWSGDGVAICTEEHNQQMHRIVTDGAGGAIIVWRDARSPEADIYGQRIDASGTVRWTHDGLPISTESGVQNKPRIAPDGEGGAIITWMDGAIMAQRVDADGALLWGPSGVAVCDTTGSKYDPQIASDGSGGAVFSWKDGRIGTAGIYAQRLSASGDALWAGQGVAVYLGTATREETWIAGNGGGGAVIAWLQRKTTYDYDIYARVVDAAGIPQGSAGGTPLCRDTSDQLCPGITTDGDGGGIVSWYDTRGGADTYGDIYAARIYASGSADVETPMPGAAALAQNYPNPFNPNTTIRFDLAETGFVDLAVYSCDGRRIATLVHESRPAGPHREAWDGRDRTGRPMPSGIYCYRLVAGGGVETKRMVLLK